MNAIHVGGIYNLKETKPKRLATQGDSFRRPTYVYQSKQLSSSCH